MATQTKKAQRPSADQNLLHCRLIRKYPTHTGLNKWNIVCNNELNLVQMSILKNYKTLKTYTEELLRQGEIAYLGIEDLYFEMAILTKTV